MFKAKNVPNILTIVRFILIPFIIYYAMADSYILTVIFFILSGLTDILDGYIARKYDFISDFGKLMDPLADKATQVATLIVLVLKNIIPFWILIVVILKEFVLVAGASFLYGKEFVVSSRWWGKLSTVLFYIAIFSSLLIRYLGLNYNFDTYIYYLAIIATMFSLAMYFKAFWSQEFMKKKDDTEIKEEDQREKNKSKENKTKKIDDKK